MLTSFNTFAIHADDLGLEKLGTTPDNEAEMVIWSYLPSSIKKNGNLRNVWLYQNNFAKSSFDNNTIHIATKYRLVSNILKF